MSWKLSNFAQSTLRQAVALADTTMYIDADEVDDLPVLGVGDKATAVLFDANYREIVYITAWATDGTLTVERAKEGTAARDWEAGVRLIHTPTAAILQDIVNAAVASLSKFSGTATYLADVYTVTVTGSIPTPFDGDQLSFEIPTTNTGPIQVTVTNGVDSVGPLDVHHQDGEPLEAGDFAADWQAVMIYDFAEGEWHLVSETSFNPHAYQLNDAGVPAANRHPNGKLDFWSNGTSFATPASNAYTADGWQVQYDGAIGAFTVNQQTFTVGQTDVPDNPKYWLRWDQSAAGAGSTIRRFKVKLPGVEWQSGKKVSRSVWLKAEAAHTVTGKLVQNFGTGGGPSADVTVDSQACSVTASWQKFTFAAVNVPSIAGKTLGSNADDGFYLYLDLPLNVTMTIDVAMDDIRPGHIAGLQSPTFPLPTWLGGLGGSFVSLSSWLSLSFLDLAAIEALAGTGIAVRSAANTWVQRSLAAPAAGFTITNPAGVAGDPTFVLANDLASLEAFAGTGATGLAYRSGVDTWAQVTIGANLGFAAGTLGSAMGTAATHADTDYVHIAGTESITGVKTFTGATTKLSSTNPRLLLEETDQAADEKLWDVTVTGGDLLIRTRTDADGAGITAITIDRGTGTAVTSIAFASPITASAGSAGTPSIRFTDATTGLFRGAANVISISISGTESWRFTGADLIAWASGHLQVGNGTAGTPGLGGASDSNSGFIWDGADGMSWVLGGAAQITMSTASAVFAGDVTVNASGKAATIRTKRSTETGGTLTSASANTGVFLATAPTINNSVFAADDEILLINDTAASVTITAGASYTQRLAGTATTGNLTLAARGEALVKFKASNESYVSGNVS